MRADCACASTAACCTTCLVRSTSTDRQHVSSSAAVSTTTLAKRGNLSTARRMATRTAATLGMCAALKYKAIPIVPPAGVAPPAIRSWFMIQRSWTVSCGSRGAGQERTATAVSATTAAAAVSETPRPTRTPSDTAEAAIRRRLSDVEAIFLQREQRQHEQQREQQREHPGVAQHAPPSARRWQDTGAVAGLSVDGTLSNNTL